MATEQIDPARQQLVDQLQGYFMEFDPEKKGCIPVRVMSLDPRLDRTATIIIIIIQHTLTLSKVDNFNAVLCKCGFGYFPQGLMDNILGVLDPNQSQVIYFGTFIWLYDTLMIASNIFSEYAQNGKAGIQHLPTILRKLGYTNLNEDTAVALQAFADSGRMGYFDYVQLISTLIFMRFSLNLFESEDTDCKGSLTFNQMEQLLPILGFENATNTQAKHIFEKFDRDKNGTLDPFEFIKLTVNLKYPHLFQ